SLKAPIWGNPNRLESSRHSHLVVRRVSGRLCIPSWHLAFAFFFFSPSAEISPVGAGLLRAATTWSLRRFPTVSRQPIFTREQSTFTSARSAVCLQCAAGRGRAHFLI